MAKIYLCCAILLLSLKFGLGANILGYIPTPSYSHQIVFRPLWKELSLRGHQVTVLTTDPMNNAELTNLTEIDLHNSYKLWANLNMFTAFDRPMWRLLIEYFHLNYDLLNYQLNYPEVQSLIKNENLHFDVVMIEAFHTAAFGFAERFKCPVIVMSSLDGSTFSYHEIGNPAHPVLHPDFMLPYHGRLSFTERLASTFSTVLIRNYYNYLYIPDQQSLITKYFGESYPAIQDIFKNYSAFFVNTDPLLHTIRPLLPNVIQIGGGTHLTNQRSLPKDLQVLLDNATNGFIYFSLGSNVKSKHLVNTTRQAILETFKELPYTVLWKFENEKLPNIAENVVISKWFPQQDIFRHPNLKLFITQGGLQSLEEAIYNHVPIIGMPVMADQTGNIKRIVSKGLGLSIDYKSLTKDDFKSTILEIMNNEKYSKRVVELAELAKDQPETGLQRAVWWTEYVIRHKGAPHLKNTGINLPWYQYYLLDVIGFCLSVFLVVSYLLLKLFILFLRIVKIFKVSSKPKQM